MGHGHHRLHDGTDGRRSTGSSERVQLPVPRLTVTTSVKKDNRRRRLVASQAAKRAALKAIIQNQALPIEERFKATLKLAEMPRNGSKTRIRNRCEVTGRPRAFYRKLKMSRIALRELGNLGKVPGIVKSSW